MSLAEKIDINYLVTLKRNMSEFIGMYPLILKLYDKEQNSDLNNKKSKGFFRHLFHLENTPIDHLMSIKKTIKLQNKKLLSIIKTINIINKFNKNKLTDKEILLMNNLLNDLNTLASAISEQNEPLIELINHINDSERKNTVNAQHLSLETLEQKSDYINTLNAQITDDISSIINSTNNQ